MYIVLWNIRRQSLYVVGLAFPKAVIGIGHILTHNQSRKADRDTALEPWASIQPRLESHMRVDSRSSCSLSNWPSPVESLPSCWNISYPRASFLARFS